MTRRIWKYEVPVDDAWHKHYLPKPAKIVHVATQPGGFPGYHTVTFWAEVDPDSRFTVRRSFRVYGTGQDVSGRHIGTAFDGPFVWHLYATPEIVTESQP